MHSSKECSQCNEIKPLGEFYRHATNKDGHCGKCKVCARVNALRNRWENIERSREHDRNYSKLPHVMIKHRARGVKESARCPEKGKARSAVNSAIRSGKLKPFPCFICGAKAVAHHPDYSAPLDVVWLCQPHHMQTHAMARKAA